MKKLQHIDVELSKLKSLFREIAADTQFQPVCLLTNKSLIEAQTYPGVYLIEIRTNGPHREVKAWMDAFTEAWELNELNRRRFTPNTVKCRMRLHQSLQEWMPLYIGKSQNIAARIDGHIALTFASNTFALKLAARPAFKLHDLRLSTINFDELRIDKDNYGLLAPVLEIAMRKHLNPLVGR